MSAIEEKLTYDQVQKLINQFKLVNSKTSQSEIKELLQNSIGSPLTHKVNVIDIQNN